MLNQSLAFKEALEDIADLRVAGVGNIARQGWAQSAGDWETGLC